MFRSLFTTLACLLLSIAMPGSVNAQAQDYPSKVVRLIVGNAPGGSTDVPSRWITTKLAEVWGRPVIADFRGGAAGAVANEAVAKAPPDGHTLLFISNSFVLSAIITPGTSVDPVRDFSPVALVDSAPTLFVVRPSLRINSMKEWVAYAKKNPGKLTFGSTGTGGSLHLYGEMLKSMAGIDMLHIPYKGGGPAMNDLLAGRLDSMFVSMPGAVPHMRTRSIVALGGAAMDRAQALPDLPSIHEQGVTGFDGGAKHGIVAPANTPPEIINKLHEGLTRVLNLPETRRAFADAGLEPMFTTPAQFAAWIKTEITRWTQVIQAAGIKPE